MCGEQRLAVLEFHHVNRENKSFTIMSRLAGASIKSLTAELQKCAVLCSNCHSIVTAIEDNTVRIRVIEDEDMENYRRLVRVWQTFDTQ